MRSFRGTAIALAVAGSFFAAGSAQAQTIFSGTTLGCFYSDPTAPCDPTSPSATTFLPGLTFTGGAFHGTTLNGSLSIGTNFLVDPTNNFGIFSSSLAPDGTVYPYSGYFALAITFSAPPSTSGVTPTATLTGAVNNDPSTGGIFVDFSGNNPMHLTYNGGEPFTLDLNNTDVSGGASNDISGHITVSPEPASMVLLGTGMLGIFGAARRKRQNNA